MAEHQQSNGGQVDPSPDGPPVKDPRMAVLHVVNTCSESATTLGYPGAESQQPETRTLSALAVDGKVEDTLLPVAVTRPSARKVTKRCRKIKTENSASKTKSARDELADQPEELKQIVRGIRQSSDSEHVKSEDEVRALPVRSRPVSARVKLQSTKKMGRVQYVAGGNLEWFDPQQKSWRPAVYHKDIRQELIQLAANMGEWQVEMARGKDPLDVTAFHPAYAAYGPEREDWPKILFQYLPTVTDFEHAKSDLWIWYDGRVVIDVNNDGMPDYPELPYTLARHADPWLLVTIMRLNNHITLQDFRGRMMGDLKLARADPLGRNRISMNMTRFRKFSCCLTWNTSRQKDTQREYLEKKLPRRCIRLNSTESFRMLDAWEVAELELQEAGKHLSRTRAFEKDKTPSHSHKVWHNKLKQVKMLKASFDRTHPEGTPNDYDTEDDEYQHDVQHALQAQPSGVKKEENNDNKEIMLVYPVRYGKNAAKVKGEDTMISEVSADCSKSAVKTAYKFPYTPPSSEHEVAGPQMSRCPNLHPVLADLLTVAPSDVTDAGLLYDLLNPTRIHFEKLTDTRAPYTESDECYRCQHAVFQDALNEWHKQEGGLQGSEPEMLIGLQYVDHERFYWNMKWARAWYGPKLYLPDLGRMQTDGQTEWGCEETDE
ncbi:MAG: hypothetical protein Q9201_001755 [Fulgogasparrea decipioides]